MSPILFSVLLCLLLWTTSTHGEFISGEPETFTREGDEQVEGVKLGEPSNDNVLDYFRHHSYSCRSCNTTLFSDKYVIQAVAQDGWYCFRDAIGPIKYQAISQNDEQTYLDAALKREKITQEQIDKAKNSIEKPTQALWGKCDSMIGLYVKQVSTSIPALFQVLKMKVEQRRIKLTEENMDEINPQNLI